MKSVVNTQATDSSKKCSILRSTREERGSLFVECAMIIPLMLMITFYTVELYSMIHASNTIRNIANEGLRLAAKIKELEEGKSKDLIKYPQLSNIKLKDDSSVSAYCSTVRSHSGYLCAKGHLAIHMRIETLRQILYPKIKRLRGTNADSNIDVIVAYDAPGASKDVLGNKLSEDNIMVSIEADYMSIVWGTTLWMPKEVYKIGYTVIGPYLY